MAVGLTEPAAVLPVAGIGLAAGSAGLYNRDRLDLALLALSEGAVTSAVFTKNQFCAAPVQVARQHLRASPPRYLIINAGNANAGTGDQGINDALNVCRAVAELAACPVSAVLPFSTGVIGEYLPVDKIQNKIPDLRASLDSDNWLPVARSMMTTDTVLKAVSRQTEIEGGSVTVTGIAKGAGMIRPDMATMLAFIATDIKIDQELLDCIVSDAVEKSFNRISVDGDTSTNDACVLVATGEGQCMINSESHSLSVVKQLITEVCIELAQAIVRDGEGATKFITIETGGGRNKEECLQVAYAIANSPLVKTAFFASDPNWGRILAAVGRAGIQGLDISAVNVFLDNVCIVAQGMRAPGYSEAAGSEVMQRDEILIRVDLGRGKVSETIWTCDLSHEYVRINAEYRT